MNYLLDTHILLWAAQNSRKLSQKARAIIEDDNNRLYFSAVSIWEVAIKSGLGRADFQVDAALFRRALLNSGYLELSVNGQHCANTAYLPDIHKDPFDRLLIVQSQLEGMVLLSADSKVIAYGHTVLAV